MEFKNLVKNSLKWKNTTFLPIVVWVGLCMGFVSVEAQEIKTDTIKQEEPIFNVVEEVPQYPGREIARQKFLQENVIYPQKAKEAGIQGTVVVSFIVEIDGSITNIKVERSVHPLLDKEAIRVTKLMPNWYPGRQRGKAVRCKFMMPFKFVLEDDKPEEKPNEQK